MAIDRGFGDKSAVYIVDTDTKKVLDIVKYKHINRFTQQYTDMGYPNTTVTWFAHLKELLEP